MKNGIFTFVLMPFLFQLQFTSFSVLWMLISLLIGLGYAFLLYNRKSDLPVSIIRLLFTLRTLAVAFIAFLLFAPLVRTSKKSIEKPLIFILLDNSASIAVSEPANFNLSAYTSGIKKLASDFDEDYEVKTLRFGKDVQNSTSLNYKEQTTDIGSALKNITENYPNRNIGAVILATDGLYNAGSNPQYEAQNIKAPIYTVALGDTLPKKDLVVTNVNYSNIVYLGNDFQIEVELAAYQCKGQSTTLSVSGKSSKVFEKVVPVSSNDYKISLPIILSAKQKGIQKFTVNLSGVAGELSKDNNSYTFFVEVIDGKQKVYILANSPHPDVAALKQSIESNKNYEVKTGFISDYKPDDIEKSNVLILHQLPSGNYLTPAFKKLLENKNCWFILGDQSNVNTFSATQNLLDIATNGNNQEVLAQVSPDFYEFVISDATKEKIKNFAPLITPFGHYGLKAEASVLLQQQIGKISTEKPLFVFSKNTKYKTAVLCGEGIWRWRIEDFKENNSHQAVDELIGKSVQYLSSKEDKRKFRVYPARSNFDESEHVVLNGELYNNTYELINTPDVSATLKNDAGKSYPFLFSRTGNTYILDAGILPFGEYSFVANTQLGTEKLKSEGKFVVSHQQAELRQTTANHQLLNNISQQSKGELIYPDMLAGLAEKVKKNELVKSISYENRRYDDLINLKALFFIALALLSLEWFSRKRNGEI